MKIQCVVLENNGISYYRMVQPMDYLNRDAAWVAQGNSASMLWAGSQEHLIDCDILVFNKYIYTDAEMLKVYKANGTKIVVDVDDHWVLPANHVNKEWMATEKDKATVENLKIADLVICTSMRLQEEVRQYNKNTVVIPNALPFGEGLYQPLQRTENKKMAFMYAGGATHLPDVRLLEGKFRKIGSDPFIKNNAEFILAGYEQAKKRRYKTKADYDAKNDNYIIEEARGPYQDMKAIFSQTGSYRVLPTAHVTEYIQYYDQADVSLIPLVDARWNSYKSCLKVLEAATRELPVIVSAVAPYKDELHECPGIMWVNEPDDWIKSIKACIKAKEGAKMMGRWTADWIKEHYSLSKWNLVRKQVFQSLVS